MKTFYRLPGGDPKLSKVAALQKPHMALIGGNAAASDKTIHF